MTPLLTAIIVTVLFAVVLSLLYWITSKLDKFTAVLLTIYAGWLPVILIIELWSKVVRP
jgi:hypothetical protein